MKQDKIFMILIISLILLISSSLISCNVHDILEGKDNRYFQSQNGNKNELTSLNSFDTEIFNPANTKTNEIYWIPFTSATPRGSNILPKSRDTIGFCIDTDFFGMNMMKRVIGGVDYQQITVPLCGFISEVGSPALPQLTRYFEVPYGVKFTVKTIHEDSGILSDYNIIPQQEFHDDLVNDTEIYPFIKDTTRYNTDSFYPEEIVTLESEPIIIRGHRLLPVTFHPLQFNPVSNELKYYSKIEARVDYDKPAQLESIPDRLLSPAFETFLDMLVPNYQYRSDLPLEYPFEWPGQERTGADYLIISYDSFVEEIEPLAKWKERKGYLTKIVKTSQIKPPSVNPTVTDIYNYIKNAYDTWVPAPSFVLLVGDSQFIPTNYRTPHTCNKHGGFETPTDLYFFTVDGDDYFPDIYYGRLCVDSEDETKTVVSKLVRYETEPPTDADFYSTIVAAAQFQDDDNDDYEDRRFTLTAEEIRDYLKSYYTVNRVYTTSITDDPQYYSNDYDSGLALPAELLKPGFKWDGNAADINGNITDGCFLVYHRDHAGSRNFWNHNTSSWWCVTDGWGDPDYDHLDIATLNNGELLPVVLSVECQSAWFDGELDQGNDPSLTRTYDSFCELFVNHPNGGAVAAIGATRNSQSGYNDQLMRGFIDAIWPEFDPAYSTGEIYHLGHMLNYGKVYMANVYGVEKAKTKQAFEMFHLIGDPEMEMWTSSPGSFEVIFPETIGSYGLQKFIITVNDKTSGNPVEHAKICLSGGNIHTVRYTNPAGQAIFEVTPSGVPLDLTVTKHNYIPYLDTVKTTSLGASIIVDPSEGPSGISITVSGSNFGNSETVNIYFGGTSITTTATTTATGTFSKTFNVPNGIEGFLNVVVTGTTSTRTGITLFRRLPDQPLPDPYIYCQWADDTWHLNPDNDNPRWNNPSIELTDKVSGDPVASNNLVVGHTYTVKATIYNDEPVEAVDTDLTFEWTFWGAGQKTWNKFGNDKVTVPAKVGATPGQAVAEADWTPSITGHICLMVTIYHPWDLDLNNNHGQENTHVQPISSPETVTFTLSNPSSENALIYLDARQINSEDWLWPLELARDYPQIQKPGENKSIKVTADAPEDIKEGEICIFVVNAYIGDTLIGGIEIDFLKTQFKTTSTTTSPATSISGTSDTKTTSLISDNSTSLISKTSDTREKSTTPQITPLSLSFLFLFPLILIKRRKN